MPPEGYYYLYEEALARFYKENPHLKKLLDNKPKATIDKYLIYSLTNYCKRLN